MRDIVEGRVFMTELLVQALVEMKEKEALQRAKQLLDEGIDPLIKILEGCSKAMEIVGSALRKACISCPT
jgi:methanogenic corrinoid protein MtbC1